MKLKYREGEWFVVPLQSGFGVGLVVRASKRGKVVFGCFFGPRRPTQPRLEELEQLRPSDTILVSRLGDLALQQGRWATLGVAPSWERSSWRMPAFATKDPITGRLAKRVYSDDDPNLLVGEEAVTSEEARNLPTDGVLGAGAVATVLDALLEGRPVWNPLD